MESEKNISGISDNLSESISEQDNSKVKRNNKTLLAGKKIAIVS